jgi:tail tube protein
MGTKPRMLGSDSVLRGVTETNYAVSPTTGYHLLHFGANALDSEQPLGYDPLLGQGRSGLDPFYDAIDVTGDITIPIDVRAIGFWLHGLMGVPNTTQVSATGSITFSAQPANTSTITLNSVVWTFVTGAPGANQTQIGVSLAATLTQLATDLNASVDAEISKCTYVGTATALNISRDLVGTGGNTFTIAASANSNGTRSAATLLGGGYSHVFTAGGGVPSKTLEVGHPELATPVFFRYAGVTFGTLAFDMQRRGPANARISAIAQGRTTASATIDAAPTSYTLDRFSQGNGSIKLGGTQLAYVTGGSFEFTNNLTPVETIRSDGKIDGVDAGEARSTGSITVRSSTDLSLSNAVDNQVPVVLQYSYTTSARWSFTIDLPRVFLPKVKQSVTGPGGVEQAFDWQAARDSGAGYNTRITLVNDEATYT